MPEDKIRHPKFEDIPEDFSLLKSPGYKGKYVLYGPTLEGGQLWRMTTPSETELIESKHLPSKSSEVYFLRKGSKGPVKIGHSRDIRKRMTKLQVPFEDKLVLLRTEPGGETREKELHSLFKKHRIRGEGFEVVGELKEYLSLE